MRTLSLQLLLATALLAWRLRKAALPRSVIRAVLAIGCVAALLSLPHTFFGWRVESDGHIPGAYLRFETTLAAAWFFLGFGVGMALWIWQAVAVRAARWMRAEPVDPGRRRLLAGAPLALAVGIPPGVAGAQEQPRPKPVRLSCPQLPAGFEGLRILQVSDLHLGPCLGMEWLEAALERVRGEKIDLVAVTGDLSDDRNLTADALARIAAIPAPLGHVIIPGNHEYYAGIDEFHAAVRASPFIDVNGRALTLTRNGDALQLLGIDWARGFPRKQIQYARMLDAVLAKAQPGFKLLLAHDPDAFDQSAPRGIDVQLSGHTHGGQIAPFGLSILGGWWLHYPRGSYAQGRSRMYVTTGLGHWFPFRVDCPTELPIIELVRG